MKPLWAHLPIPREANLCSLPKNCTFEQPANLMNCVAILKMQTEQVSPGRACRWFATTVLRTDISLPSKKAPGSLISAPVTPEQHTFSTELSLCCGQPKTCFLLLLQLHFKIYLSLADVKYIWKYLPPFFSETQTCKVRACQQSLIICIVGNCHRLKKK